MSAQAMIYEERYGLGTGPVAVDDYISKERFEAERDHIFKKCWLPIARVEDIPNVGDYFAIDVGVLETSVILVRETADRIRAFHNACSHRCNKLLEPGKGHKIRISCKFHGWSFDLSGKLHSVSNVELFANLDKEKLGLRHLSVDTWQGFIFINREVAPSGTLKQWLGELYSQYDNYFDNNKRLEWIWGAEDLKANWKTLLDASSESYHAPTLHANTLRNAVSAKNNPHSRFNRLVLYRYHRTGSVYANPEYRLLPTESIVARHATTRLYPASAAQDGLPLGINPDRDPNWAFDALLLFPNVFMLLASGWYSITWIWPNSADSSNVLRRVYMFEPKSVSDIIARENMMVSNREVFRQDMSTVEGTHQMMRSGAFTAVQLCDEEVMIRHSLAAMKQFMREHR